MKAHFLETLLVGSAMLAGGCASNEVEELEVPTMVKGFKAYSPDAKRQGCNTVFAFFAVDGDMDFITQAYGSPDGWGMLDASDEVFDAICRGEMPRRDGTRARALYVVSVAGDAPYAAVNLPRGRYFVAAACREMNGMVRDWSYLKYATTYYNIGKGDLGPVLTVTFPMDPDRWGLVPWVSKEDEFDYGW